MKKMNIVVTMFAAMAFSLTSSAWAQNQDVYDDDADEERTGVQAQDDLPTPASDDDPQPPVAKPIAADTGVVKQAGVGGDVAYGRAGVLELGGSAGFTATSDFMAFAFQPTIGWFFSDNMQLSAIMGVQYVSTEGDGVRQGASATTVSLLAEPSYHVPFNRNVFGFLGLGIGAAYADGPGMGFAFAPRLGANLLVGRSGILTPSLSYRYTTHDAVPQMEDGMDYVAVSTALMMNVGYTVMW
jgi:hypothetical protein